jgi:hypothetical protein
VAQCSCFGIGESIKITDLVVAVAKFFVAIVGTIQ